MPLCDVEQFLMKKILSGQTMAELHRMRTANDHDTMSRTVLLKPIGLLRGRWLCVISVTAKQPFLISVLWRCIILSSSAHELRIKKWILFLYIRCFIVVMCGMPLGVLWIMTTLSNSKHSIFSTPFFSKTRLAQVLQRVSFLILYHLILSVL